MSLVPSGKRRIMVSQYTPEESLGHQIDDVDMGEANIQDLQEQVQDAEETTEGNSDVRSIVFDFLVNLGYPPRRLHEFKSQFVSETGSADGGTKMTVVVPDKLYGKDSQIPKEKIKELINKIEHFDLSYVNYERKNEQLTLQFVSSEEAKKDSLEDEGPGDILDKVYGKGKKANTIQEFIKRSQDLQMERLRKIIGANNVTKK